MFAFLIFRLRGLISSENGSIAVMGMMALSSLLGMSGLAVEVGNGYAAKIRNQRVADLAALGAGLAYKNNGQSITSATQVANDIVIANGLPTSNATVTQTTVGTKSAIQVTVTTAVPVRLATAIGMGSTYNVTSTAAASLVSTLTAGCIQALSSSGTYGITLSGGTSITATGCAINTNSGVTVPYGTSITGKEVNAGKTIFNPGTAITTNPVANNIHASMTLPATDTVGTDPRVIAGFTKLGTYTTPTPNSNPTTPAGSAWSFDNSASTVAAYKTADKTYVVPAGTYTIGALTVSGGISVTFNGPSTITIAGGISNGGAKLTFTGGTISINGGINTGSAGVQFGNADVTIGSGTLTFTSSNNTFGTGDVKMNGVMAIGGGSKVVMGAGAHSFNGVTIAGGSNLTLGAGDLNVTGSFAVAGGGSSATMAAGNYVIGNNGAGNAISVSGGSVLTFGDGQFSANGGITTSGGSTLNFGITASHYINGALSLNGSSTFGAGAYYINGNFTNNTGGSMTGSGVTFFLAGSLQLSGGTSMAMTAPTTDTGGGITDLLFATKSTAQTKLGGGSQNTYAGVVYAPNSDLVMDGGAGATGGGRCFMLVVNTFSMSGGTTAATSCASLGAGSAGGTLALIL
jgi:Flp pilus assembly protein TadG